MANSKKNSVVITVFIEANSIGLKNRTMQEAIINRFPPSMDLFIINAKKGSEA